MSVTLTSSQTAILNSTYKSVSWLFRVIDASGDVYNWSTKTIASSGVGIVWQTGNVWACGISWCDEDDVDYSFKVIGFSGVAIEKGSPELGVIGPSDFEFSVTDSAGALTASDFEGGQVLLSLRVGDGVNHEILRRWIFDIKTVEPANKVMRFICRDYLAKVLNGYYPNTPLVRDLFPANDIDINDNACVPIPYGTAYLPVRSVYIPSSVSVTGITFSTTASANGEYCTFNDSASGFGSFEVGRTIVVSGFTDGSNNGAFTILARTVSALSVSQTGGLSTELAGDNVTITQGVRKYLLGQASRTYTLSKCRTPMKIGTNVEWSSTSYTFTQSSDSDGSTTWRSYVPIIMDVNNDGTMDAPAFWKDGQIFLDVPTQFTRDDTSSYTTPAKVIWHVLNGFGIPSNVLNDGPFAVASSTFAGWGLVWQGGYYQTKDRRSVIAELLNSCHARIIAGNGIEIKSRSKTSQATITQANVIRTSEKGFSTFIYRQIASETQSDCGYVAWQSSGEPIDRLVTSIVPAKGTTATVRDSEILNIPFVYDSQDAKALGTLHFQRKLSRMAEVSFVGKSTLINLEPDDVITINATPFGGNYSVVIDSIRISKDLLVSISCSRLSVALDDFTDLAPAATVPQTDDTSEYAGGGVSGTAPDDSGIQDPLKFTYLTVGTDPNKSEFTNIQSAINALPNKNAGGIFIKNGTYTLTQPVYLPPLDTEVIGESEGGVVIKNNDGDKAFIIYNKTKNYKFSYLTIESQNTSGTNALIYIYGSASANNTSNVMISNVTFNLWDDGAVSGSGDMGVYGYRGNGKIVILNCLVDGGKYGFRGNDYDLFSVLDCELKNQTTYGTYTTDVDYTDISRNTITDPWEMAIYHEKSVDSDAKSSIANNRVYMSADKQVNTCGIRIYQCRLLAITGNVVQHIDSLAQNYDRYGIRSSVCSRAVYKANAIDIHSHTTGVCQALRIYGSNNCVISGNAVKYDAAGGTASGVYLGASDRNVVSANNVEGDTAGTGVYLDATSDNNQGGDQITYNVGTSISDNGAGNAVTGKDI